MSLWEIFTWLNVGVLAFGSTIVFALFLRQLPKLLASRDAAEPESDDRASTRAGSTGREENASAAGEDLPPDA